MSQQQPHTSRTQRGFLKQQMTAYDCLKRSLFVGDSASKKHHFVDSTDLIPLDNNSRGGYYKQRIGIQKTIASRAGLRAAQEPRPTEGRHSLGAIASPSPSDRPLLSFELPTARAERPLPLRWAACLGTLHFQRICPTQACTTPLCV